MNMVINDFLRAVVSNVMSILLLFSLAQPKYNKRITHIFMFIIILADVLFSMFFYLSGNITAHARYSILWHVLTLLIIKPLFLDGLMQWLFNLITTINAFITIVILSYLISYFLPYPMYSLILIRFILFGAVILLFRRWLRPLYRQAVTHWKVFILLVVGFLVNFMYYAMFGSDIRESMTELIIPLLFLIILEISAYICIFYSLKTTAAEYALKEENIKIEASAVLLQSELSAYDEFINFTRHYRHDLRHHNAVIREMLSGGDVSAALTYLNEFDDSIVETALKQYCNNPVANAIFRLYENRAQAAHSDFVVNANISEVLSLTAPEIGGLISNLLENAWIACQGCVETGRYIVISADTTENQFFLEVKNSVREEVRFTDGMPVSTKKGGGTGSKSIMHIVHEHSGMCRFKQEGNEFVVQIVLPLR